MAALRAWYESSIDEFRAASRDSILGSIARNSGFDDVLAQKDAWVAQIDFLRDRLRGFDGSIFFEFTIPRMGRRIDVVLLSAGVVFAIEFKVGETVYRDGAVEQVWDYALDLKNFHEPSRDRTIRRSWSPLARQRTRRVSTVTLTGYCDRSERIHSLSSM